MIKNIIEKGYEDLNNSVDISKDEDLLTAVNQTLSDLDRGNIWVAEKSDNGWIVNDWIKKAILLYFSLTDNSRLPGGISDFYDKVPLKYNNLSEEEAKANKVRIVPRATARYGSYQAPGVILMPSYVNIGAYVDEYTMVDTWATVGSCAQIGKNVHLSGGVGIGGKLHVGDDIIAFAASDRNLKENITVIPNALDKVNALSGNTFTWKSGTEFVGGKEDLGVIAQEVEALGLVGLTTTRDDGTKAVRYDRLIPVLIQAVMELSAKVTALEGS